MRDDRGVVASFRPHTSKNDRKSIEAGRPIFDDEDVCELRFPGSKNVFVFPAVSFSHWDEDGMGGQRPYTYAERFPRQYQQYKSQQQQTKQGTPLDYLPFLTQGKRAELRALNIYTAEALAGVDGAELKNLGPQGRELKNSAIEFIANSSDNARLTKMEAELEGLRARNQLLEEDIAAMATRSTPANTFDGMSDEELREHVKAITGMEPKGNLPRKTLVRMVQEQGASA
jgi:hypothetical protein